MVESRKKPSGLGLGGMLSKEPPNAKCSLCSHSLPGQARIRLVPLYTLALVHGRRPKQWDPRMGRDIPKTVSANELLFTQNEAASVGLHFAFLCSLRMPPYCLFADNTGVSCVQASLLAAPGPGEE